MRTRPFLVSALFIVSSAFAAPVTFFTQLSGLNESPVNASPGTGTVFVTLDTTANTLFIAASFQGMTGPVMAAHIHCCIAAPGNVGVATQTPTFIGFPAATQGFYSNVFNTSLPGTFNAAFVTANGGTADGAEARLAAGLLAGEAYFNIHTSAFPGGEIRGFLVQTPEPSTCAMAVLALAGIVFIRRKR
jgi:hypothetical protein